MAGGGLTLLSIQLLGLVGAQPVNGPIDAASSSATRPGVQEEELLLFAVELDSATLTDSLAAYGDPNDPLLPVGELARLLDLNIVVSPSQGRVTGSLGEAERALTVDLGLGLARAGGHSLSIAAADFAVSPADIFIRASVLQQLLPLRIEVDSEALVIKLVATEKLPIQSRMERQQRQRGAGSDVGSADPLLMVESPYLRFTPPAFDVALETGTDTRTPRFPRRYDVRVAGDLLHMGYQGYVGSDEAGSPSTSRLMFERRSREGGLLGPLDATYVSAGDVFTPTLALGARSVGGRGITFSTAPLGETSVFQRIDLRGELPIGYDVELYINDILRSGQRSPVEGRYEFLNVPLVRGLNVIRLVTYGPRGERSEQTRVINVGGGQLAKGTFGFDFGLVEQERPLFDLRDDEEKIGDAQGFGKLRAVASFAYGLSNDLTVVGGAAVYPGFAGEDREMLNIGARGSLFGMAVQADAARDRKGGTAIAAGFAGQPFGISTIARHSEYSGGFVDETVRIFDPTRPLRRHSELTLDMSLPPIGGKIIPLSFRFDRDEFRNGGVSWLALARASTAVDNVLLSTGFDYQRETTPAEPKRERLTGNLAASTFVDYKWQLRGVIDYDLLPTAELSALSVTAAREISDEVGLRFGVARSFRDRKDLNVQGGAYFRLPFADLAVTGDYATAEKDWRIGIRLAFGLAFDPGARRYRVTRPGPAGGGSAVLHAFIDHNADGVFDPGDSPVPNVTVEGGERKVVTGADGRAFVTGLGNSVSGRLRVGVDNIDNFYVSAPPSNIEFAPRPGHVVDIAYPLAPVSEVVARVSLMQGPDKAVGLSSVRVRLVRAGADPIEGTTEYDGSVIFGEVPPGTYRFEIDPEQAARLHMRLKDPVTVVVTVDGASEIQADVIFEVNENG
jgi:hypothetical protein